MPSSHSATPRLPQLLTDRAFLRASFLLPGIPLTPIPRLLLIARLISAILICNLSLNSIIWVRFYNILISNFEPNSTRQRQRRGGEGLPFNSCLANSNTATILVLGFHSVSRSMPRHMVPLFGGESLDMLGW